MGISNIINGEYSYPVRVVALNIAEGWSRGVTEDIAEAVLERGETEGHLSEPAKNTLAIMGTSAAARAEQGQDRPDSKCERTNKTNTKMGGRCGFVCKDLVITAATGEAKASGFQYVCSRRTSTPSAVRQSDTPISR
jgi:hypothetical protein